MIARFLFLGILWAQGVAAAPVSQSAFTDLERAVGRTRRHGVSHKQLQSMADHDALHGLDSEQNALLCGPYSSAPQLKHLVESHVDANHAHPVFFSQSAGRACYAVSSYAENSALRGAVKELGEDFTLSGIPHALKLDASVVEVADSLEKHERFSLELMFGLGMGGKGLYEQRPSVAITADVIATGLSASKDSGRRKELLNKFYWSSGVDLSLQSHPLSKPFSKHPRTDMHCSFDQMHMDMGRASVTLTAPRGTDRSCLLLLASVSALHRDVSLVLAHKGHVLNADKIPDRIGAVEVDPEPYDDATPATDQNAFIQSGNSVDTPYSDLGMNGTSYVVGYIDSGADDLSCFLIDNTGTITPRTPGEDYGNPITEPWRRKVIQYIAWGDGSPAIGYDHGTWCAGSTTGKCIDDSSSANDYNGVAPGAKLTMFDVDVAETDNFVNVPSLYDICLPPAYSAGARIHSDSWGTPGMTSQTSKSLDVDEFTYENPDFLFVVAAANDGMDGYKSVGSPGVSKNALTIGATASNHDELVYFSSVGPTYDGSIKPDIVAPGQNLMSAGVRIGNESDSCNVQLSSGTSMATPIAAGAAVLVRQYLENPEFWGTSCTQSYDSCPVVNPGKNGGFISGALLKAALIHSGEAISYHQAFDGASAIPPGNLSSPPPDVFQGWGQVLLKNLLPVPGVYDFNLYVADYQPIASLQATYFFVDVTDPSLPLRATISWTDPTNVVWAAKNLLNDLDLIILSPKGDYYYGNGMKGDEHNPVERYVQADGEDVETGVYTIIVVAKQLITSSQDFSIVITCIGEVQEDRTYTAAAYLPTELNYENATEACQGPYGAPTGNVLVRFQLEDWLSGASWEGLNFIVQDSNENTVSSCTFVQNADVSAAPYTRSSQCTACLPDDATYTAKLDTSKVSEDGLNLVRVATTQCDNVFLSSFQEEAEFSLSGGGCNYCPSGYTRMEALMKANVTDDDYVDYSWYGLAYWSMYSSNDLSTAVFSGTLMISDEEADRYCVPNGEYTFKLDDSELYKQTGRHALVTFSSTNGAESVTLSGLTGDLSGSVSFGMSSQTWYEAGSMRAPVSASATFGASVSEYGGLLAVGAPTCESPCTQGGTVNIFESTSELKTIISPDASIFQDFGFSVAMSQHYVVIGAPGDESTGVDGGKVYIYELDNDDGVLEVELDESFTPGSDDDFARFGTAVAIYEGTDDVQVPENSLSAWVAVGAPGSNTTGVVSVYAKIEDANDDDWTLLAEVKPPDTVPASGFGRAVAWYNDVLVASGVNNITFVGFVLIYSNDYPNTPVLVDTISAEDPVQGNEFGLSLSLFRAGAAANFGYVLGVGAPGVSCAYVFTNNPDVNEWTQNSRLVAPPSNTLDTPSLFGFSIAVDEDAVLVGSPGTGGNAGSVVAFLGQNMSGEIPPVQWSQQAILIPADSTSDGQFGASIALTGPNAIIGAPGLFDGSGAVYVFVEGFSAAPTMAPTPGSNSNDNGDDDDGWNNLDSFNNLAILILCLGIGGVVGIGVIVYFKLIVVKGPMQESFLNSA